MSQISHISERKVSAVRHKFKVWYCKMDSYPKLWIFMFPQNKKIKKQLFSSQLWLFRIDIFRRVRIARKKKSSSILIIKFQGFLKKFFYSVCLVVCLILWTCAETDTRGGCPHAFGYAVYLISSSYTFFGMNTCLVGFMVMYVFVTDGWQSSQQSAAQTWDQTLGPGQREKLTPSI